MSFFNKIRKMNLQNYLKRVERERMVCRTELDKGLTEIWNKDRSMTLEKLDKIRIDTEKVLFEEWVNKELFLPDLGIDRE